ncbi:MAG: hypothetical protein JKY56_21510 [Kofleriaceae bacterium]|nr:hypothetical protein [Kofleriaceae bacterium]
MDPKGVGTIEVQLNNTAAQLLASLCVELGTEDATGVLSQALGVLDLCVRSKAKGSRVCIINSFGETSEVVI